METMEFDYQAFFIFLLIVGAIILFFYLWYRLVEHWKKDPKWKEFSERKRAEYMVKRSYRRNTSFWTRNKLPWIK